MADRRVVEITDEQVIHPFHGAPYVIAGRRTQVDTFPCYPHNPTLVTTILRRVDRIVGKRVVNKPTVYVLHHETDSRTNGWADIEWVWPQPEDAEQQWRAIIVLPGKRIPIHPAMTRYVVVHEYGHHVEHELLRRRGLSPGDDAIRREYAQLRGANPDEPYGGRHWHASPGELLANDFRIVVCDVEPDFWPHPGFEHPARLRQVRRWWEQQL